jgi:DNA-3-methyladenine glycosylase II
VTCSDYNGSMHILASDETVRQAAEHLTANDPALAPVIARAGLMPLRPHTRYYQRIVESIIGQQISVAAAASIRKRFLELFDGDFPAPEAIIAKDIEELRSVGLSRPKAVYIRDLAERVADGRLEFDKFDSMSNEDVSKELVAVKGVGEWTAHMFLMFAMGRLDVLAIGDLGIRNGIKALYGMGHVPTPAEVTEIAATKNWHPYETVACWYIWRSLENMP